MSVTIHIISQDDTKCNQKTSIFKAVYTTLNRAQAFHCADAALRSWVTSHSVLAEPTVWVEDANGVKVYEAWTTRRRVRHVGTGEIRVETPIQLWRTEVDAWESGAQADVPCPSGHLMFERPEQSGCAMLEPFLNPVMVR